MRALAVHPRPTKTTHVGNAQNCWLAKFKYLSTVSGGGYVGGWLSAWLFHAHGDGGGGWGSVWKALVILSVLTALSMVWAARSFARSVR